MTATATFAVSDRCHERRAARCHSGLERTQNQRALPVNVGSLRISGVVAAAGGGFDKI